MNNEGKIKEFTDLNAWKEAHELVLMVYRITKTFPQGRIIWFNEPNEEGGYFHHIKYR